MSLAVRSLGVELDGRPILSDVSLTVETGAWTAVVGPNGAGKSTFLRALLGLVASTGEVTLAGASAHGLKARRRARLVAYAPQSPILPADMTVSDYALLGRSPYVPYLGRESAADRAVVTGVLARLDLTELASRRLNHLSGGERQRAVLARALAQQAPILLLDEPTTALDLGHQQQVMELVDRLRRDGELTVVSSLHDLTLAAQYADGMVLLSGGRVAAAGSAEEVLTPALIREHFGARVHVLTGPGGQPLLALEREGPACDSS